MFQLLAAATATVIANAVVGDAVITATVTVAANQEDDDKYKYVSEFQKIKGSGIHKIQDYFVEFTKQTNSDPDYFMTWLNNDASGADAREFWNQYQQFLAQKEKEEKAQKENEENEETAQTDDDFLK